MFTRYVLAPVQRVMRRFSEPKDWKEAYTQLKQENERLENQMFQIQANIKAYLDSLNNPGVVQTGVSLSVANTWLAAQTFNTGTTTMATVDINGGFIDGVAIGSNSGVTVYCTSSGTGAATLRVPHGTAPSSPVDGDIWTTTAGMYVRINGATVGPLA